MTAIFLTAEVTIGAVTGVLTNAVKASGNAIGVTIGAAIGMLTNALKASGNAIGKGLKEIRLKVGSTLPGLIYCERTFQKSRGSGELSCRAHLVLHFGRGCLYCRKAT